MYKSNTINSSSTVMTGIVIAAAIISVILAAGSISTYIDNAYIKFASAQLEKNKIDTPTKTKTTKC